ncbi:FkbM family methyltransferase [Streptomyces rectiverticillatus]|uniref:FkbM family methyltransferase n=1 Tax=Streptomyces rectiverticillatus TaxID=173860 RepID=UPI0015C3A162|nr:FkbM family methyltransferase [Streptomyces rectiverticillatus]QLE70436.1 FkbM family methyltransferase [Streptomyces rectiverticillatus]
MSEKRAAPAVPLAPRQEVRLPDGRRVSCTSPAEALLIWREATGDGLYGLAARQLRPHDTVLDVGANVGLVSIAFADVQHTLRIVAAEPVPDVFACLQDNLTRHVPGATPVRTAVGTAPGVQDFTYYPAAPGNSGFYADRAADDALTRTFLRRSGLDEESVEMMTDGLHDGCTIEVPVTTVSELMREHGLRSVALLKVDVERAELDVLRGVDAADWPRIGAVVAEVHDESGRLAQLCELLEDVGLAPQVRQDPGLRDTEMYEVYARRSGRAEPGR